MTEHTQNILRILEPFSHSRRAKEAAELAYESACQSLISLLWEAWITGEPALDTAHARAVTQARVVWCERDQARATCAVDTEKCSARLEAYFASHPLPAPRQIPTLAPRRLRGRPRSASKPAPAVLTPAP